MKKLVTKVIPVILVFSLSFIGCNSKNKVIDQRIENISQVNVGNLEKYKDSYVGDISALHNIVGELPANIYEGGFSLKTDKEPYGITVSYKVNENLGEEDFYNFWSDKELDKYLEKNAIMILGLVQNAENIEFNVDTIGEINYRYNRKDLEKKHGKDLKSLLNDDSSLEKI